MNISQRRFLYSRYSKNVFHSAQVDFIHLDFTFKLLILLDHIIMDNNTTQIMAQPEFIFEK